MEHAHDEFSLVPKEHVPLVLSELEPLLKRLEKKLPRHYQIGDVVGFLLDGTLDLWVVLRGDAITGFIATRILDYPRARCLSIQFAAGEGLEVLSELLLRTFYNYARDTGCSEIEVIGRPGWARHLEPYGFKTAYVAARKEI